MGEIKIWTGERLETTVFNDNAIEHLHRYALALEIAKNKIVLDIASGEGYGSNLLAKVAKKVYGVDIDNQSVMLAKEKYPALNLEFKTGQVNSIPLEDNSVDAVISFETLEHHDKHQEMMLEVKRVLKPDGVLLISTPEKERYSIANNDSNRFHIKELYLSEFRDLISSNFKFAEFLFQNIFRGSLIIPEEKSADYIGFGGDYQTLDVKEGFSPMYVLAIASNSELLVKIPISGFDGKIIETLHQEKLNEQLRNEAINEAIQLVQNSWSFRLGKALLSPLRFLKR